MEVRMSARTIHVDDALWTLVKQEADKRRCSAGYVIRECILKQLGPLPFDYKDVESEALCREYSKRKGWESMEPAPPGFHAWEERRRSDAKQKAVAIENLKKSEAARRHTDAERRRTDSTKPTKIVEELPSSRDRTAVTLPSFLRRIDTP
jgi:hypothetical protein